MTIRRLTISLRALLALVLAFGLLLGWRVNKANRQRDAVAAVKRHGGWVHYDWEFVNGKVTPGRTPPAPEWLRQFLGDEYFQDIESVSFVYDDTSGARFDNKDDSPCDGVLALLATQPRIKSLYMQGTQATDTGLAHLKGLTGLEVLMVWDARSLTDAGIAHLAGMRSLKNLHINNSKMTDAGLGHLKGLPGVESLSLQGNHFTDRGLEHVRGMTGVKRLHVGLGRCEITDSGLVHLVGLRNLEVLDIQHSRVADAGLMTLSGLPKLREIWITEENGTVTPEGVKKLQAAMPNLKTVR